METIKNNDRIVIEYTCCNKDEKKEFLEAFMEIQSEVYPIGTLSLEINNPNDLTIVFSTTLANLLFIYYLMGASYIRKNKPKLPHTFTETF